jgi:hypothetical protein
MLSRPWSFGGMVADAGGADDVAVLVEFGEALGGEPDAEMVQAAARKSRAGNKIDGRRAGRVIGRPDPIRGVSGKYDVQGSSVCWSPS